MLNGNYSLRYIHKFEVDLYEAVDYISVNLHNRVSAMNLIDKIENEIKSRNFLLNSY